MPSSVTATEAPGSALPESGGVLVARCAFAAGESNDGDPGAVCSTTQTAGAGVESTLPARSVARTASEWPPSASELNAGAAEQGANAAPSREHSNVDPGWLDPSVNAADEEATNAPGAERIAVWGS